MVLGEGGGCTCVCKMLENRAARAIRANKVHRARGNGRVATAIAKWAIICGAVTLACYCKTGASASDEKRSNVPSLLSLTPTLLWDLTVKVCSAC